jgi:hypothetical protein
MSVIAPITTELNWRFFIDSSFVIESPQQLCGLVHHGRGDLIRAAYVPFWTERSLNEPLHWLALRTLVLHKNAKRAGVMSEQDPKQDFGNG